MGKRRGVMTKPGDEVASLQMLGKEEAKRTSVGFPETGKEQHCLKPRGNSQPQKYLHQKKSRRVTNH